MAAVDASSVAVVELADGSSGKGLGAGNLSVAVVDNVGSELECAVAGDLTLAVVEDAGDVDVGFAGAGLPEGATLVVQAVCAEGQAEGLGGGAGKLDAVGDEIEVAGTGDLAAVAEERGCSDTQLAGGSVLDTPGRVVEGGCCKAQGVAVAGDAATGIDEGAG